MGWSPNTVEEGDAVLVRGAAGGRNGGFCITTGSSPKRNSWRQPEPTATPWALEGFSLTATLRLMFSL